MSNHIPTEQEKYDDVLMQIAGQIGSVQGLLDKFFGFLHRKTDFYVQFTEPSLDATMGFPVGVAEKMVLKCFRKYRLKDYKLHEGQPTSHEDHLHVKSAVELGSNKELPSCVEQVVPTPQGSTRVNAVNSIPIGKQIPIGNGGVAENYYWTQTLNEVTVHIDAPTAMKGKDVKCNITSKFMTLSVDEKVLVEGEFEEAIRADESMWTLNLGKSFILFKISTSVHEFWAKLPSLMLLRCLRHYRGL
jgi:N-terminal conserved domain of Nudc./CS domain